MCFFIAPYFKQTQEVVNDPSVHSPDVASSSGSAPEDPCGVIAIAPFFSGAKSPCLLFWSGMFAEELVYQHAGPQPPILDLSPVMAGLWSERTRIACLACAVVSTAGRTN